VKGCREKVSGAKGNEGGRSAKIVRGTLVNSIAQVEKKIDFGGTLRYEKDNCEGVNSTCGEKRPEYGCMLEGSGS